MIRGDTPFGGSIDGASDMVEEFVAHFYTAPERIEGEEDKDYQLRCEADRQGVMIKMSAGAQYSFAGTMVDRVVRTVQDGSFGNATLFKLGGGDKRFRSMVLDWIDENFDHVSPDVKSRCADVITHLLPALQVHGIAHDRRAIIDMVIGSGKISVPAKLRVGCEIVKEREEAGLLDRETVQGLYDKLVDEDATVEDVKRAGGAPAIQAKQHGTVAEGLEGTTFTVTFTDQRMARSFESRTSRWVEWSIE